MPTHRTHKQLGYDDEELCQDLAKSDLSVKEIATKHKISVVHTYHIAAGTNRPELKERIDELIQAEKAAGMRLARSRARWTVGRLVQIAGQDEDRGAALRAIEKLLEMGGMLTEAAADDKKTIEIVLSAGTDDDPLNRRLTGVWNGN